MSFSINYAVIFSPTDAHDRERDFALLNKERTWGRDTFAYLDYVLQHIEGHLFACQLCLAMLEKLYLAIAIFTCT